MAVKISNQQKWRPWKAIILFVVAAIWIIGGSVASGYIGIWGSILTQVGILGTAIAACLINKTPLKEVFPMKRITVRDFFGTIFMWNRRPRYRLIKHLCNGPSFAGCL